MRGWVRPARLEDIAAMEATGFREADIRECAAANEMTPADAMQYAIETSPTDTFTIVCEGTPVGMFGACPWNGGPPGLGIPWLLATDGLEQIVDDFIAQVPGWFDHLNKIYPVLINWVDDRNEVAKRWLRRCGCEFIVCEPYGTSRLPFWRFERRI